jgi:hypothetical protein
MILIYGYGNTVSTNQANGEQAVARTPEKLLLTCGHALDPGFILEMCTAVKKSQDTTRSVQEVSVLT